MFKVSSEIELSWVIKLEEGRFGLALEKTKEKKKKQEVINVVFTTSNISANYKLF